MSELRVVVIGPNNTGRTTVARIIEDALHSHGIHNVEVKDTLASPDKAPIQERLAELRQRKITVQVELAERKTYIPSLGRYADD